MHSPMITPFHLSITGLRVKPGLMNRLRFQYHAVRSFMQARKAEGVLHVTARRVNGVEHTVTAWRDREAMLAFVRSGAHLQAMKAFHRIAEGATFGLEAERIPDWNEVHALWKARGVVYGAANGSSRDKRGRAGMNHPHDRGVKAGQ